MASGAACPILGGKTAAQPPIFTTRLKETKVTFYWFLCGAETDRCKKNGAFFTWCERPLKAELRANIFLVFTVIEERKVTSNAVYATPRIHRPLRLLVYFRPCVDSRAAALILGSCSVVYPAASPLSHSQIALHSHGGHTHFNFFFLSKRSSLQTVEYPLLPFQSLLDFISIRLNQTGSIGQGGKWWIVLGVVIKCWVRVTFDDFSHLIRCSFAGFCFFFF